MRNSPDVANFVHIAMKAALEILGIPTWHWVSMAENTPDLAFWANVMEAKWESSSRTDFDIKVLDRDLFDNLLGHWGAVTDQPAVLFAEELVGAYPEAKVVLVERDVEKWYASYCKTVIAGAANWFIPLASAIDRSFVGQMARQTDLIARHYFNVPNDRQTWMVNNPAFFEVWRQQARQTYVAHYKEVRRVTPPERLLNFSLDDGWEPLCRHLGKPIPDVPFPRVNETEAVQEKIKLYIGESYRRTAVNFAKRALGIGWLYRL